MGTPVKCCLCREEVNKSGWCPNCRTWPINVTPIRYCERAHRVDVDGFCRGCKDYVATRLEPRNAEWRDTGEVPKLLSREENLRRLKAIQPMLDAILLKGQPIHRDIQEEKRKLAEWDRRRKGEMERVPF